MADNWENAAPGSRPESPNGPTPPKNFNSFGGRNRYSTKYPVGPDDTPNEKNLDKSEEFAQMASVKPPARITADGFIGRRESDQKPDGGNVSENSSDADDQSDQDSSSPRSKAQSASGRGVSWREQKSKQGQGQRDGSSRSKSKSRSRRRSQRRQSVDVNNELLDGEVEANREDLKDNEGQDFPPPPPLFNEEAMSQPDNTATQQDQRQNKPADEPTRHNQNQNQNQVHNQNQYENQKQNQNQDQNENQNRDEDVNENRNRPERESKAKYGSDRDEPKKEGSKKDGSKKDDSDTEQKNGAKSGEKPEESDGENKEGKKGTKDDGQSKFSENADLKERRARRKTPSAPPTADTEKRSTSRKGRRQSMDVDLNDDSESNTFTFVDSMFRAPRVVKWAAGGMTALMFSMLFIALQHRLFGREFVARKWMSIIALSVVVVVLLTMVFSSVNPVRFVRKFRSDNGRNQADKEKRKADLLKQF